VLNPIWGFVELLKNIDRFDSFQGRLTECAYGLPLNPVAQFENSNLSVAQFCQSIDCSVGSFYLWKRKMAKPTPAPSAFLRVQTSRPTPTGIEIKLPSGITSCITLLAANSLAEILEQVSYAMLAINPAVPMRRCDIRTCELSNQAMGGNAVPAKRI
jgi:hypothetical protein